MVHCVEGYRDTDRQETSKIEAERERERERKIQSKYLERWATSDKEVIELIRIKMTELTYWGWGEGEEGEEKGSAS